MDFTRQRNADIMRVYRSVLASSAVIALPVVFETVAQSPSARFWVSEERATNVIAAMEAGRPVPRMRPNKQAMFQEIYRRYAILRKKYPKRPTYHLVSIVVNQPAPKFYFTARTIGEFIYRIKSGWYDKHGK